MENQLSKQFAEMIRQIMLSRNINQTQLTKKMSAAAGYEIKRTVVNRALTGNINLTLNTVELICTALDVDIKFTTK